MKVSDDVTWVGQDGRLKSLRSLDEFNRTEHSRHAWGLQPNRPNGIACPLCGEEMVDSSLNMTFASSPPQKAIACKCGYNGMRIA